MQTQELVHAAAVIASGMVQQAATLGQMDTATMATIARTSVELAKLIEEQARKAYSSH